MKDYLASRIYLIRSSYSLEVLSIRSKKLDIYKDIERVRKKLKNAKHRKSISTKTTFESIYNDNSIELGEVYCRDEFVGNYGFGKTERLHSKYSFDPSRLFLNVDVDRLIKNVNLSKKVGFLHLFNSGKIKRKSTELRLVEEQDSVFIVSFSTIDQTGFIKYNKHNYLLEEYRVLDHRVDKSFYSSINKDMSANIDTLILDYRFEHGFVKTVSFYYSTDVQNAGTIKTNGIMRETDFNNQKYSTNSQLSSIQFDAFVSDFSLCQPTSSFMLAVGKEKEAIAFYLDVLQNASISILESKQIYESIIHSYHILENETKVCEYLKKWRSISGGLALDLDVSKCEE